MVHKLYSLKVKKQTSNKKELILNQEQLKLFGLSLGQKLTLQVGFNTMLVEVTTLSSNSSPTTIYLSEPAFSELIYYHGQPLYLALLSSNRIVLGPTLGITVSSSTWRNISRIYAIKKRALLALEKGIFFYCFHLNNVDLKKNLVEAYVFNPIRRIWEKNFFPFPQILYHRSTFPFNKYANGKNPNNIYHKLWANPNVQRINSTYSFDKWQVYKALAHFKETSRFQPETTLLTLNKLKQFLAKYEFCFVKGNYGRCGRQVLRVEKEGEHFTCKFGGSKIAKWNFNSSKRLYIFLRKRLGKYLILQQGITLARIDNRPFDIRVLVQKNHAAKWTISALSFRIADPKAIVTNIAAGAKEVCVSLKENFYPNLSPEILEGFCHKTLLALEAFYGTLGEVGLDVAIDVNGKLWLIEANSQPSSRGYKEAATEEVCNQIFGLPLDYGKYLVKGLFKSPFDGCFSQQ